MLGDAFSLIKNLIIHRDLKGLLLLSSHQVSFRSNEPLALWSFYLILSHEVWKLLYVTVTKRKTIDSSERLFWRSWKKTIVYTCQARESKHSLEIPAGLLWFQRKRVTDLFMRSMAFPFSGVKHLFDIMSSEDTVKEKEKCTFPFICPP